MSCRHHSHGFTMIELITIIMILGILAVVAVPRLESADSFRDVEFRDRAIAVLRYAHKTASSHRRLVCVTLAEKSIQLRIDNSASKDNACDVDLAIPGGSASSVSATRNGFESAPTPAVLYFRPDGRVTSDAAGATIANFDNKVGGGNVLVRGATGYVGDGS